MILTNRELIWLQSMRQSSPTTEIVKIIVKTKGVDVDATCKTEVNGKLVAHGVLGVAVKQPHPSIEIIKILLEFVRNPVSCDKLGVPACIVTAFGYEYFDILELFRGKACLLGAIDGSLFFKLATIVITMDKPPVLRWLLKLPEVIKFKDEGEEVKKLLTFGLLKYAFEHERVEMCELLTEFMGERLSGIMGDDGMSLKDYVRALKGESPGGLKLDVGGMSLKDYVRALKGESLGGVKGDDGMSLKDHVLALKEESLSGLKGDVDGMSLKDYVRSSKGESLDEVKIVLKMMGIEALDESLEIIQTKSEHDHLEVDANATNMAEACLNESGGNIKLEIVFELENEEQEDSHNNDQIVL